MNLTLSPRERHALRLTLLTLPIITISIAIFVIAFVANLFFSILVMFFISWLLAFLLDPVVTRLTIRLPLIPRGVAAALVFVAVVVFAIALLAVVASSVITSLTDIIGNAPTIDDAIARLLAPIQTQLDGLGLAINLTTAAHDLIQTLTANTNTLLNAALNSGFVLFSQGTAIIFIAVVFVANKGRFLAFMGRLIPAEQQELYDEFVDATARSFGGFVRGQFGLAALYGVIAAGIGLFFGVPFTPLIGMLTAVFQSVPYFGQLVSWAPLVLISLIFKPDVFVPVAIIEGVTLFIVMNVVTPRVMGNAVGINPVLVLAAVFIGAQVAGAFGAVFGVPVLAVIVSLLDTYIDRIRPEKKAIADSDPGEAGQQTGTQAGAGPSRAGDAAPG